MKKFLALYMGSPSAQKRAAWDSMSESERAELQVKGMTAWGEWAARNSGAIVDSGTPLGKTKRASAGGIEDTTNQVVAYAIVQAESHEAAARLFESHPHFAIFPGDSVEIMECLPIPGAP